MKRLFAFIPAVFLVLFLLNSFVFKEKEAQKKVTEKAKLPTGILYKSHDGGQTWLNISDGLPKVDQSVNFFAGESDLFVYVKNVMYHSKSNSKNPVWEKENVPNLQSSFSSPSTSIAFNRSGIKSFNYKGQIFQKMSATDTWTPILTNFKKQSMRTIFETSDGTIFLGYDHGLYKSTDQGKNWKHVQNEGWVSKIVESEGVLIATGTRGIMRSTDNGEHWNWVIREGGVGIAVERIADGFAAIVYNTKTKSRTIHISSDKGNTWNVIGQGLRPSMLTSSIKQIGKYLICGHPDGIFRSSDMGNTWSKVHPGINDNDFEFFRTMISEPKNVFSLHVSGNVLYAVAGSAGC